MDFDTLLPRLEKLRYFEGYTKAAISEAISAARKKLAAGLAGENREAFERFPGLALVVTEVDMELTGYDDLELVLGQLGNASFGIFAPRSIQLMRKPDREPCGLRFEVNGIEQILSVGTDSWIPGTYFEELAAVTKNECSGLEFQAIEYPDSGQSAFFVWCTPRALRALERAKLAPSPASPLNGEPPPKVAKKEVKPDLAAEFAPPADPDRVDRLGVFRRGKWRIPFLSEKYWAAWREFAGVDTTTAIGHELRQQIGRKFDLLCARDLGMAELGSTVHFAQQVVSLVKRYFAESWRVNQIEKGRGPSEVNAAEDFAWEEQLRAGCAAATKLGDVDSLQNLMRYPCEHAITKDREAEMAYYRLLSDVVRGRNDWNWPERLARLETSYESRHPKLAACLVALRDDNSAAFTKAIRKFATKPLHVPPFTYSGAIDPDVTTLCGLALRKGWPGDFPERLQDKILDPRILD